MNDTDILQPIPNEDIPKLRTIYEKNLPRACHIYNYLSSIIKWKDKYPDTNCITLLSPYGNWRDGTFVGIHEYYCYEIFMFTLEKDCETLCKALAETNKIEWNRESLLYAIYVDHFRCITKILGNTPHGSASPGDCDVWWIPKEKALQFNLDCPSEVYVSKLDESHVKFINPHWPNKYATSDKYIAIMIERNGGYGLFLKSDNTLVAWVVRNMIGMGVLQTSDRHKRKGYGSLITKVISKHLAEDGGEPLGIVSQSNPASQNMYSKLGFFTLEHVVFSETYK